MNDYEAAKLKLTAFGLVEGWGVTNSKGDRMPNNFEQQKELAEKLIAWAIAPEQKQD